MAVRAADSITLAVVPSPSYVRQYYLLQASALLAPALPTTNPPVSPWSTTEPSYTAGSTNTLYTVMLTAYGSVAFEYGPVQQSSSFEAAKQAYNLAANAASAAAAADGKANTAQTTADGKNKIVFSTSNASGTTGYVTGDIWFKKTGSLITGQWEFVSGAWASRTLDDAVIGNLNAGTISAGTLNAARIGANSLTVEKIAIGDFTNFVTDPKFIFGQMNLSGTRYPSTDVAVPAGAPSGFVLSLPATYDMFSTSGTGGGFPVTGGDQFFVEAWVCHTGVSTAGLALRVWTSSINQTNGTGEAWAYPSVSVSAASAQNTWVKVSGVITVPVTATQGGNTKAQNFGWAALGTGGPTGTGWWIADWNLRRMSKGELIVDGAITAQKMLAGTITAASGIIADAAITSAKILDANITTAKIADLAVNNAKISALDAAKISTGFLAAARIQASTISTTKLLVGNFENLLEDPGFETNSIVAWNNATANVTKVTTTPRTGTRSLRLKATTAAYEASVHQAALPVEEGEQYVFGAWIRAEGTGATVPGAVELGIKHGTVEATTTSVVAVTASPDTVGSTYVFFSGTWVVPAGAKFARPRIVVRADTSNVNVYLMDDLTFYKQTPGYLIVDGAITANKIGAGEVVAGKLSVGAVAAENIQAGSIIAEKMAADSVTANSIAAGAILANKIAAGQILTTHLAADVGGSLDISANSSVSIIAGQIAGVEETAHATQGNLENMQTYYKFGPTGAVISTPSSPFALALRNDKIEMLENGNVVSYWTSGQMHVSSFIGEEVILGNHKLEKYSTGTVVRAL